MKTPRLGILLYGNHAGSRNAFEEEKYAELANAFLSAGFEVETISYNDALTVLVYEDLVVFDAILVWVNPIEQGNNRHRLDRMLSDLAGKGVFVSTLPEIILKMGTKEVLYATKDMDWSGDVKMYTSYEDFQKDFPASLKESGIRVLKQYRGNGGNGVFKITLEKNDHVSVTHAASGSQPVTYSQEEFNQEFKSYFDHDGMLIDQEWNIHCINGMVRCYLSGDKVAGFGYQEINALYEYNEENSIIKVPPGKRYYFTERCGLFSDLKDIMENKWVPQLQEALNISSDELPVIWDADFFINQSNAGSPVGKYTLCEINVSCVSPFPPSAIKCIVKSVEKKFMLSKTES
jgi:hypothetical protein